MTETKEARTVPPGASDGKGDLGEAVIGPAVPGKTVGHHHHPLRLSIPLPHQNRTGREFSSLAVKAGETGGRYRPGLDGGFCQRIVNKWASGRSDASSV